MSQYQRLFLIADPDMRHSPALQRAAALAQASGAKLHIAAFVEPFPTLRLLDKAVQEQTRESYLDEHRGWLQDEAALLRSKGVQVTVEATWSSDTLKEILLHVEELKPDLVIKDIRHEPLIKRAFATPLDWHLLRECPAPLHLVGESTHALPRKIIAAVDPSRPEMRDSGLNDRIIQAANGLALQCDAELHLLHAYDLSPGYLADPVAGTLGAAPNLVEELRTSLHQSFIALAEHYGVPCERRHFIMGPPIKAIADFATTEQADVMVMGTVQRKGLEKLIGSTTEYVLYRVPCSVLAVKPEN